MTKTRTLLVGWLLRSLILFALWMLLVDDPDEPDVLTGIATALAAALAAQLITAARGRTLRITPPMLRRLHRPLVLLITDSGRVTVALIRALRGKPPRGRIRVAPYRATSEHDPEARGRRLRTQWGASLGANRYVVGIDSERRELIVHELVPADGPLDPMELG